MTWKALIQPTGDEILSGIVADTDSPMIAGALAERGIEARRAAPVPDRPEAIRESVKKAAEDGFSLMILIGGSGGGHRFDPALSKDYTHTALEEVLTGIRVTDLYGKNGHLWSRLLCGYRENMLVFNVPGPYREAEAAVRAFLNFPGPPPDNPVGEHPDLKDLNRAVAEAVAGTYHL